MSYQYNIITCIQVHICILKNSQLNGVVTYCIQFTHIRVVLTAVDDDKNHDDGKGREVIKSLEHFS